MVRSRVTRAPSSKLLDRKNGLSSQVVIRTFIRPSSYLLLKPQKTGLLPIWGINMTPLDRHEILKGTIVALVDVSAVLTQTLPTQVQTKEKIMSDSTAQTTPVQTVTIERQG